MNENELSDFQKALGIVYTRACIDFREACISKDEGFMTTASAVASALENAYPDQLKPAVEHLRRQ